MKQLGKSLLLGLLAGAVELAAAGLLAGVGKAASFEDLAFGLGIATLVVALLSVFTVRRVQSGMNVHPGNAAAQSAFTTQVAFDEAKTVKKLPAALSGAWSSLWPSSPQRQLPWPGLESAWRCKARLLACFEKSPVPGWPQPGRGFFVWRCGDQLPKSSCSTSMHRAWYTGRVSSWTL